MNEMTNDNSSERVPPWVIYMLQWVERDMREICDYPDRFGGNDTRYQVCWGIRAACHAALASCDAGVLGGIYD